ncbi:PAAR-like domain-containing protein [Undibacterium sp. Ren11W]|uniref:PAAR-like domain-containing protein n=1 Tax=Undibacterium sp. Ren11W TaxID=3413045 RepID=UPI003BF0FC91
MSNPIGARKNANFKAISTAPSFNKTPVGSATPPLPYPTVQDLGNSVSVVASVKFNGNPAYVLNKSTQPKGKGDNPGVAKGVKSNTVNGEVKPVKGSSTVNVDKQPIIRDKDPNTMNSGNNPGIYTTTQMPSGNAPKHAANNSSPKAKAETKPEKSLVDKALDATKSAAQKYKDTVSDSLHDFAGSAMDKGGTIAAAGGGTAAVGGAMVLTGIGAAPGAVVAAGGGVVAAIGGGVSAVGGIVESAATVVDAGAAFVVSGKLPNMVGIVTSYGERMIMSKVDKLTKLIPGMGKKQAPKASKKSPENDKKPPTPDKPKPVSDGMKVVGSGNDGGRCKLRPYKDGCPSGTPHHVVPDHCFKQPGENGAYYPGAVKHADGLSICVEGATKSSAKDGARVKKGKNSITSHVEALAQHGQIHVWMDAAETALGAVGNPKNTATLGQLENAGAASVAKVTGCDKEDLKKQLRQYHQSKGMGSESKLRADPFGRAKDLDPTKLGTATRSGGAGID